MAWATETQILLDIERSIGALRTELRLHIQKDNDRHKAMMREIESLKRRRSFNINEFVEKFWAQILFGVILASGNTWLIGIVQGALSVKK